MSEYLMGVCAGACVGALFFGVVLTILGAAFEEV